MAGLMGYVSRGSNDRKFDVAVYHSLGFAPGAVCDTAVSTSAQTFLPTHAGQRDNGDSQPHLTALATTKTPLHPPTNFLARLNDPVGYPTTLCRDGILRNCFQSSRASWMRFSSFGSSACCRR
jgi:hypothetical protein